METVITTKLTKGGQTTVPKEIRNALGIGDEARVWWRLRDGQAIVSAEAPVPNEVRSSEEFWDGIAVAMADVADGRTRDASIVADELRHKYGL